MQSDNKIHVDGLKTQLHKTFSFLQQCRSGIQELDSKALPCIKTIANLTEQFQCCTGVSVSDLPSKVDFCEVKQKLLFKISSEINENVSKLHLLLYGEYSDGIGRHYDKCMSRCAKCNASEDLSKLLERSPLYPSMTDMLQWIEITERLIREAYLCKKFIIDTYTPDLPAISDRLESSWTAGDKELYKQIDEYLALTRNFVELKVS
ncbi:AFG2-interacting ribosome maturation factor-like isoform X2 [Ruditapes philippinarum]|uniref:AFG2-interacting ribosome maturation factor-like isoform X2 n=1 Tax=Ruditapes philippinarum TaxID=129788 RepID=UPI00295B5964|nr:AFG2-interacting ribosome maturation factor-like isoform X2 [Ruditapes philippinarum]